MISEPNSVGDFAGRTLPELGRKGTDRPRWRWLLLAKIVASTVLLAWILSRAGLTEIFAAIGSASLPLLLAAYAVRVFGAFLPVFRWRLLLRAQGAALSRMLLLKSYLVASFFNNFLPSTVGGDASRAYDCYRMTGRNPRAMWSVVVDRLLGLLALVVLALIALPFATRLSIRLPDLSVWLGIAIICLAGVVGAFFFGPSSGQLGAITAYLPDPVRRRLVGMAGAFDLYRGRWRTLAVAFGLSVMIQLSTILFFIIAAQALGLRVPLLDFCVIVPLLMFVIMLPISINGIGLRESALAVVLGAYGVAPAHAVALAWLDYAAVLTLGLIGGAVYALRR
jgi:uncharacterized membrane protein YbhN (UPF0104 family)